MAYLLDILRAGDSNESGVFTFWEKNMGKINVVMYVTTVSFPKNRFFKRNCNSKKEINYMAYLSYVLRSYNSKRTGVSSF